MTTTDLDLGRTLDFLLMAGRIMLESGAETSRIEETTSRMALALGVVSVSVFCTPTGLFVTVRTSQATLTQVTTVEKRTIDLEKVARVNSVSRELESGTLDLMDGFLVLTDIQDRAPSYSSTTSFIARGLSCACWATLIGGHWGAFIPSMLAGFLVQGVTTVCGWFLPNFLSIFFSALIGTGWAVLADKFGPGAIFRDVVIGVILPLVPGLALTNSIRDLIAGDLLSGVARCAEAALTTAAIAGGVYAVLLALKDVGGLVAP